MSKQLPPKKEQDDPKRTYRQIVAELKEKPKFRASLHHLVRVARNKKEDVDQEDGAITPDQASRLVQEAFYITDDELKELGLTREDLEPKVKKCSNNTTFMLLDFAKMMD